MAAPALPFVRGVAVDLFHRDLGGAGKPPLILLHGLLGSSRNWLTAGAELAKDYHVWALDLRNHGKSPHTAEMDYPAMVEDVVAFLDGKVGAGPERDDAGHRMQEGEPASRILQPVSRSPVTLLGHSMGGKVAMLFACRHPERVARLVVVDIAPKQNYSAPNRASFAAMNELHLGDLRSRAEAELRLEARVTSWGMRKFLTTNLEQAEDGAWRWQVNVPVLTAALTALEANPLGAGDTYAGPARFIAGAQSNYIETGDEVAIQRHFPRADLVRIEGAGHNPHMDARDAFVAAVRESG